MGNFYVNHTVRAPQDRVVALLESDGHTAFISPTIHGYTAVFDERCDTQDESAITDLGCKLSAALDGPVVAFLNHDDDVLCYWVFEKGELIEAYNSCPDYFDTGDEGGEDTGPAGDGAELCRLFGRPGARDRVRATLADPSVIFASMAHQDLAGALGLPGWTVGTGYRYLTDGDAELDRNACVHVGGRAAALDGE